MAISIFSLLTVAHSAVAVVACGGGSVLRRRLRGAQLVRVVAIAAAVILIPANVYCAFAHPAPGANGVDELAVFVTVGSLTALCVVGMLVLARRIPRTPTRLARRVLAVGAHPDDLELACGGTIARLADSGHEVHTLVMSHGGSGGDSAARRGEAVRAAMFLGVSDVQVFSFTDTCLEDHGTEMVDAIETAIRRFNPDIILTHSSNDQHQDHLAVHLATLRAARRHPAILCYESPSVSRDFVPSVFIDIEDYLDVKVAAVAVHHDQEAKAYMSSERVRSLAVHRGGQAKVRYAEGYEPVRVLGSPLVEL